MVISHHIACEFEGPSEVSSIVPMGRGHINDTYVVQYYDGPDRVLQRLNGHVFPRPDWVMENIVRVTRHLQGKLLHLPDGASRHLEVIPTREGACLFVDEQGGHWRMYRRMHPTRSYDRLENADQAYWVGHSFAKFQAQLADLPAPRLHETIVDFHHTPRRLRRLQQVAENDSQRRLAGARAEFDFAMERQTGAERLLELLRRGELTERITHNDTKLNNLLFDEHGQEPLCVVDLDTVMPGLVHYDFGDMIRTGCSTAPEDEADLNRVGFNDELFEGIARGYLEAARPFITLPEVEQLAFSSILMTLEVGIRFLTDYLEGDVYFKVHHPGHNLQRARSQFALVRQLEVSEARMHDLVMAAWLRA